MKMVNDIIKIELEDGKYVWSFNQKTFDIRCERYGKPWRNETGDKALYALFDHFVSQTVSPLPKSPPLETLENGQHFFSKPTK